MQIRATITLIYLLMIVLLANMGRERKRRFLVLKKLFLYIFWVWELYWLCITNRENWEIIEKHNIWGVSERHKNTIMKVKKGDKLVFYVKQELKGKVSLNDRRYL